jgi:integrating conjugative element relaxase (TIGR03760 family)
MASEWLLLAAGVLGAGGLLAAWRVARGQDNTNSGPAGGRVFTSSLESGGRRLLEVQPGDKLIDQLKVRPLIDGCRDRMGFDYAVFQRDCQPVIRLAAEWAQMLPASEAHHHAQPGGLTTHMLETAFHALRFRQGYLLPVGAEPEEIPARKHRWTYAVFLAAIVHDIGRPIADLDVRVFRANKSCGKWHPLAGSMVDQGHTHYTVDFELTRDYGLHKKLPIVLFQRLVPAHVLSWLAEDTQLMSELSSYLSGDDDYRGVLREIVTLADSESVKLNLLQGPRTRFASARTVPLIERLMQALRLMLGEGRLSLNRAGSHGWVYDGKVWFVSKRLADEVRQFLTERESGDGIPGKDKNDRLFDTWQEYGALIPTEDNRAVWQVTVSLEDGWEQTLTVLCFPLDKLYQSPASYPEPMKGRITYGGALGQYSESSGSSGSESGSEIGPETAPDHLLPNDTGTASETTLVTAESPRPWPAPETTANESLAAEIPPKARASSLPPLRPPAPATIVGARQEGGDQEFLSEDDSARHLVKKRPPATATLKPVAPAGQTTAPRLDGVRKKEPTGAALRFMRWVQEGLSDGSMAYNRADAMIHFVDVDAGEAGANGGSAESVGMMLVSPRIFRKFAELYGEEGDGTPSDRTGGKLGTGIQRHVINAGWHLVTGDKKSNIQKYMVIGQSGEGKKLISGVVILDPARFVNPLPPRNPCIVRFDKPIEHAA